MIPEVGNSVVDVTVMVVTDALCAPVSAVLAALLAATRLLLSSSAAGKFVTPIAISIYLVSILTQSTIFQKTRTLPLGERNLMPIYTDSENMPHASILYRW
jgi:hypothetical protein